jgi:hypothetical protein
MSKRQQETDLPLVRPVQSALIWGFRGENSERHHVFKSSTIQALNPWIFTRSDTGDVQNS